MFITNIYDKGTNPIAMYIYGNKFNCGGAGLPFTSPRGAGTSDNKQINDTKYIEIIDDMLSKNVLNVDGYVVEEKNLNPIQIYFHLIIKQIQI